MALDTYANLQTKIVDTLEEDNLTSHIPDFITLAETSIFRDLRVRETIAREYITLPQDSRYLPTPDQFLEMRSLRILKDPPRRLKYLSPEQMNVRIRSGQDTPDFFTIFGTELELDVIPASADTLEMIFYKYPASLSDSNTTNTILNNYPNVYLYGALTHSAPFLKEDDRLATWGLMYQELVKSANRASKKANNGGPTSVQAETPAP